MTDKLYRSRKGKILGLCQGIADWRDIPVSYVRWGFIILAILTGGPPIIIAYVIISLILDLSPVENGDYKEGYFQGRKDSEGEGSRFNSAKGNFESKEKEWESRFNDSQ